MNKSKYEGSLQKISNFNKRVDKRSYTTLRYVEWYPEYQILPSHAYYTAALIAIDKGKKSLALRHLKHAKKYQSAGNTILHTYTLNEFPKTKSFNRILDSLSR